MIEIKVVVDLSDRAVELLTKGLQRHTEVDSEPEKEKPMQGTTIVKEPKKAVKCNDETVKNIDLRTLAIECEEFIKNGRSSTIKQLLKIFEVKKISELDPIHYEDFYAQLVELK